MKTKLRHSAFLLLFLIPLLAFNAGYFYVMEKIYFPWQQLEQQRLANQKLGEIAAVVKFNYHMSAAGELLREKINDALTELPKERFTQLNWEQIAGNALARPFPDSELIMFYRSEAKDNSEIFFANTSRIISRRSLEIAFSCLVDRQLNLPEKELEKRRNEKLLKKLFGSGADPILLAEKQKAVVTPIIYQKIPSFLIWDFCPGKNGSSAGFFLIVKRNQNLKKAALELAGKVCKLGKNLPGGFIRLFESGSADCFFPSGIAGFKPFAEWRKSIGIGDSDKVKEWQLKGFPWQHNFDNYSLFTRIIPEEKHLLFILLPAISKFHLKKGLFALHLFFLGFLLLAFFRGFILNQWPGTSIKSRFTIVFSLAATLPLLLFLVSSSAYIFDRLKADESLLEDELANSLLDFDAGKEQIENDYLESFRQCMRSQQILQHLSKSGLAGKDQIFSEIHKMFNSDSKNLPLSGIALLDLQGKIIIKDSTEIPMQDLQPLVGFYGHNIALNLRKKLSYDAPESVLPRFEVDEKNLAAYQAYGKDGNSMELELERFRGRIFRTKFGRGKIVTLHEFFIIKGQPRFALFICWLDSSVDSRVLSRSANLLALKNPKIRVMAFKNSAEGLKPAFKPDRSFSPELIDIFKRTANSSLSSKAGLTRSVAHNMSLVGYVSPQFFNTALVASIDHYEKNQNHFVRLVIFVITGCCCLTIIIFSGIVTFMRIARPLEKIRNTLDEVREGNFEFSADMERQDEIGTLNREFKKMINGLQQRQRLASILSDHAIAAISTEEGSLKGEETDGVILISDIRNFTTLGETYPPAVLTEMLNRHFAEMAEIIVNNGGRIYKFIGDAIEAVFINEKTQISSPQKRALKAAVLMLKRLQKINQARVAEGTFAYQIGVGLAYGEIIAGETGSSETRLEFAMLGKPFKKAETYEAFTKNVPGLKLAFDKHIADSAKEIGFALQEHEFNGQTVYSAAENCLEFFSEEEESIRTLSRAANSRQMNIERDKEPTSLIAPEKKHNFKIPVFLIGAACLIFAIFALISSRSLHFQKNKEKVKKMHEETLNLGILKAHYADPKSIFEDLLQFESDQVAARLPWQKNGVEAGSFSISIDQMLKNLQASGLQPSQFAALHCSGGSGTVKIVPPSKLTGCKLVKFIGDQSLFEECETLMQRLIMRSVASFYPKEKDFEEQMNIIPAILGIKQKINILYNDFYARAHSVIRQGKDEYFYWQAILQRNPDFHVDLNKQNIPQYLREKPSGEALTCVGSVLFHFSSTMVKNSFFKILGKSLQNQGLEYIMIFADGKKVSSPGFPINSELLQFYSPAIAPEKGWLFKEKFNQHEDTRFRVILAIPFEEPVKNTLVDFFLPVSAFLLLLWIWFRTVFSQKALAGKFRTQLWTGLLAAAIVPISSVYLVNELNAVDREKISIDQERTKLINQFEKLERRQLLQETLIWEKLDQISKNSDLEKLMDICDENLTPENLGMVEQKMMELTKTTRYNEAIVYSNKGWHQSVFPQKQLRETGEFKRFVQVFISDYFADLDSAFFPQSQEKLGSAVKNEMTREAGLDIFRNLFGSDAYFSLVHGLDLPIRIFANTGIACLKMLPVPQLQKPERMFFWLFLDNMNQTLRYIFRKADTDFAIFTDSKVMYGAQKHAHEAGNVPDIVFACRWLNATKAPVSISSQVAGYKFLIEGRVGRINEVMLLIGMIPEELILNGVETNRKRLLLGLILSVMAIVILSLALSSDFIRPIQELTLGAHNVSRQNFSFRLATERKDELGQLLLTFNQMVKGLQEKEMMGKMVSRSAQKIAADEERLHEAEQGMKLNLGILYITVPAFAMFIETMPSKQLIGELKEHITNLCRIIMENGGDVDKLMGEKILAIFYSEEGKTSAIKQMIKTIEEIRNAERNGRLPFPVTLGAHFGEVLAGLLGVGNQRDFTVIGDPVNTAARICAKASELPRERFLVSSLVARTCQLPEVEFRNYGEVELKGKAETIELFQLFFKR